MGDVNKVMIGPAGTVDLHVTSTTGYEERQQWGGKVQAQQIPAMFDQWLNGLGSPRGYQKSLDWVASVLPYPFPALSRHALLI